MNSLVDAQFVTVSDAGSALLLARLKQEALQRLQKRATTCTPELIAELEESPPAEITGNLSQRNIV